MPFPGIILSPVGKACVSCQDKELIAAKGLAVVDCSWNRLEDVPFGGAPTTSPAHCLSCTPVFYLSLTVVGPADKYSACSSVPDPHACVGCLPWMHMCALMLCQKGGAARVVGYAGVCWRQRRVLTGLPWGAALQGASRGTRRACCPGCWRPTR